MRFAGFQLVEFWRVVFQKARLIWIFPRCELEILSTGTDSAMTQIVDVLGGLHVSVDVLGGLYVSLAHLAAQSAPLVVHLVQRKGSLGQERIGHWEWIVAKLVYLFSVRYPLLR